MSRLRWSFTVASVLLVACDEPTGNRDVARVSAGSTRLVNDAGVDSELLAPF